MPQFLRRTWKRYSKLGGGRKKKQVYRKPTGRDNKMREKKKGHPATVSVGYRSENKKRYKIKSKTPIMIYSIKDLENIGKEEIGIVGNVGKIKKIKIVKLAKERGIPLKNINAKNYLKKNIERKKEKSTPNKSEKKTEPKKESKEDKK
jgi:large subunit ribosomal protein L32e